MKAGGLRPGGLDTGGLGNTDSGNHDHSEVSWPFEEEPLGSVGTWIILDSLMRILVGFRLLTRIFKVMMHQVILFSARIVFVLHMHTSQVVPGAESGAQYGVSKDLMGSFLLSLASAAAPTKAKPFGLRFPTMR